MNWKKQKVGEIFFVRILEFSGIFVIFVEISSDPAFVYDLTPKKAIFRVFDFWKNPVFIDITRVTRFLRVFGNCIFGPLPRSPDTRQKGNFASKTLKITIFGHFRPQKQPISLFYGHRRAKILQNWQKPSNFMSFFMVKFIFSVFRPSETSKISTFYAYLGLSEGQNPSKMVQNTYFHLHFYLFFDEKRTLFGVKIKDLTGRRRILDVLLIQKSDGKSSKTGPNFGANVDTTPSEHFFARRAFFEHENFEKTAKKWSKSDPQKRPLMVVLSIQKPSKSGGQILGHFWPKTEKSQNWRFFPKSASRDPNFRFCQTRKPLIFICCK